MISLTERNQSLFFEKLERSVRDLLVTYSQDQVVLNQNMVESIIKSFI